MRNAFDAGSIHLRGQVGGGWALEIVTFLGLVKWHRADRRVPFGAQKSRDRVVSNLYIYVIKSPIQLVRQSLLDSPCPSSYCPVGLSVSEKTYT